MIIDTTCSVTERKMKKELEKPFITFTTGSSVNSNVTYVTYVSGWETLLKTEPHLSLSNLADDDHLQYFMTTAEANPLAWVVRTTVD